MNFFKLYVGDYQRDTAHLSILEHGVYLLMLQHYYATEKPLPVGRALYRMLRATEKAEREAIDSVVKQFWVESSEGLVNERADVEIMKANTQAETNRRIAVQREAQRKVARGQHEPNTIRATNRQRSQTPDTRETPSDPVGSGDSSPTPMAGSVTRDPVKEEVWKTGRALLEGQGMTRDAAGSFLGKLVKDHGQNRVLTAVREAARDPKADVRTWLVAACMQRESEGKQSALERRNAVVAENWLPPELRDGAV